MFMHMKVGKKLALLVVIGSVIAVVIGFAGAFSMNSLNSATKEIGSVSLPVTTCLEEIGRTQVRVLACESGGIMHASLDMKARQDFYERIDSYFVTIQELMKKYEGFAHSDSEKRSYQEFVAIWDIWKTGVKATVLLSRERDNLLASGKTAISAEVTAITNKMMHQCLVENRKSYLECSKKMDELVNLNIESGNAKVKNAAAAYGNGIWWIMLAFAVGLTVLTVMGTVISRNITRPLAHAAEVAEAVASGDFSRKTGLERRDEIGVLAMSIDRIPAILEQITVQFNGLEQAAAEGNLSFRGNTADFQGKYRQMIEAVNMTFDNVSRPINRALAVLERLHVNDATKKIETDGLQGDYLKISQGVNSAIEKVIDIQNAFNKVAAGDLSDRERFAKIGRRSEQDQLMPAITTTLTALELLIKDTHTLADAGQEGRLDVRANASVHHGAYYEIVASMNAFIEAVSKPVEEIIAVVNQMAKGDLTARVKGNYQGEFAMLKDNINTSFGSLESTIGQVMEAVQQVNSGSQQIADASQSLSQGATEQAASLEEITSSMTQIGSQITHNAESAGQASSLSGDARRAAEDGARNMEKMVDAMRDINHSSQQIAKVNKVIDDIAFQTNLLALNAAVEAARAGVHGKGFAVVADEVRNLAGRSAKAAKETAEMIDASTRKAENGLTVAEESALAFKQIVDGIVKVAELAGEIATASSEQAQGIGQVNQGLGQIDQVTQQNTANAEETAAAAEELSSQANHLLLLASKFRISAMMSRAETAIPEMVTPVAPAVSRPSRPVDKGDNWGRSKVLAAA